MVAALSQAQRIPSGRWGNYILSRYVRLYVIYLPLFLLALAVKWDQATFDWIWRSFLFVPLPDRPPVIGATWMLSYFMLFYFIFSLAFLFHREAILGLIFSIWVAGIVAYSWLGWKPALPSHWASLFFNERNLDMLLGYGVGVILRNNCLPVRWARGLCWVGLAGLLGGTALLNIYQGDLIRSLFLGLPIALFILGLAALEKARTNDWPVRVLAWRGLVWLGGTSYVLDLSHGIFLQAWNRVLPITPGLTPVITLAAVAAAALGTMFWEEPVLQKLRSKLKLT